MLREWMYMYLFSDTGSVSVTPQFRFDTWQAAWHRVNRDERSTSNCDRMKLLSRYVELSDNHPVIPHLHTLVDFPREHAVESIISLKFQCIYIDGWSFCPLTNRRRSVLSIEARLHPMGPECCSRGAYVRVWAEAENIVITLQSIYSNFAEYNANSSKLYSYIINARDSQLYIEQQRNGKA